MILSDTYHTQIRLIIWLNMWHGYTNRVISKEDTENKLGLSWAKLKFCFGGWGLILKLMLISIQVEVGYDLGNSSTYS